jgi:signal peptidase II
MAGNSLSARDSLIAARSPAAYLFFGLTALVGIASDLWVKSLTVARFSTDPEPVRFIPGWIEFEYVQNHGAVFGMGQGHRLTFLLASAFAIAFLFFLFATSGRRHGYQILLGMLMAGVIGNLYDRVEYGYVRDMIHALPRWPHLFPWVFNIADTFLSVGVSLMILYSLFSSDKQKHLKTSTE